MPVDDVTTADCCCFSRPSRDFRTLSDRQVMMLLKMNQFGVLTIVVMQSIIFCLWLLALMIPGFALYDGAAGCVSAYTHGGFWLVIEFNILLIGVTSTYFGLNYSTSTRTVEKGVHRVAQWITLYMVALVFGIISHLLHASLTLVEVSTCTSTLCSSYYWVMICLIVFLFVSAFLSLWQIVRACVFQNNLCYALASDKIDTTLDLSTPSEADDDEEQVKGGGEGGDPLPPGTEELLPEPSAPPGNDATGNVDKRIRGTFTTPLLAQVGVRHGLKVNYKTRK